MNFWLEQLDRLFNRHHLFCLKTSALVTYLYNRKSHFRPTRSMLSHENRKKINFLQNWLPSCRFWLEKSAQYSVILAITFRALYISFLSTENELKDHLSVNPLVISVLLQFRFLNGTVLRCTCLLTLFLLYVDYSLYFRLDGTQLEVANEVIVENGRHFVVLNSRHSGSGPIKTAKFWFQSLVGKTWQNSPANFKFFKQNLISFPNLSVKLRTQLAVTSAVTEMAVVLVNIAIYLIMAIVYCAFLVMFLSEFSPTLYLIAATELFFTLYDTWNAIRQCLFLLHTLQLFVLLAVQHLGELTSSLHTNIKQRSENFTSILNFRFLTIFQSEYWQLLAFAWTINEKLVSQLLFFIFASNIAINLVIIGNLLFKTLYTSEQLVMMAIIGLQTVLLLSACLGLSVWSKCYSGRTDGLLYRAQMMIKSGKTVDKDYELYVSSWRSNVTMVKLKLMAFYEQVCTNDEFRFTLGYLGKISPKSLLDFFIVYSGFVLYVAKMVSRGRL